MEAGPVKIREAVSGDLPGIACVRDSAIKNIAPRYYGQELLNEWAGPVDARLEMLQANDADVRIVAEIDGKIVGYGELVTSQNLLGACYIASSDSRKGIGRTIVRSLEQIARDRGLDFLHLESSSNAEAFYIRCGYRVVERGLHTMRSGQTMACVKMHKELQPLPS